MAAPAVLRPLTAVDTEVVLGLQAQCYAPHLIESARAFEAKLAATAVLETCWLAADIAADGAEPLGYVVALPVCPETFPALDAPAFEPPAAPRLLYLHDLAVAPAGRGRGLAQALLARVVERCRALALPEVALIAVQGSVPFWASLGFAEVAIVEPRLAAKLASFGAEARYMRLVVAQAAAQ